MAEVRHLITSAPGPVEGAYCGAAIVDGVPVTLILSETTCYACVEALYGAAHARLYELVNER